MIEKKVACFYRVSTKQQIIEDDIPVQRNACINFIAKHSDWRFYTEYVEKGVSGFKVKASDREKLEELKEDALKGEIDILLVYMFDRLGRIEEETPFVLKWFVDQGIEVWSVNEGQRKFSSHVDNLLNYITFWQAAGESKKTQIRTLEAKQQMVLEGRFQGCSAPFGYKHIPTGEVNKKGRILQKLVIDEKESEVVKMMFNLTTSKGYGARRIAKVLNDKFIPTKKGKQWADQTVKGILKNSMYKGYFTYSRTKISSNGKRVTKNQYDCDVSDRKYEDLTIVNEEQWEEVKKIIESRAGRLKSNVPKQTNSSLLLTGFIYCSHCGARMTLHYGYVNYKRKDGTITKNRIPYYECYNKTITKCINKTHSGEKTDKSVMYTVLEYLNTLETMDIDDKVTKEQSTRVIKYEKDLKVVKDNIKKIEEDIKLFKREIINVIKGTSKFTEELLSEQISEKDEELNKQNQELNELTILIEKIKSENENLTVLKKHIPNYREILEGADIESKKMVLSKFVNWVKIGKEEFDMELNKAIDELIPSYID